MDKKSSTYVSDCCGASVTEFFKLVSADNESEFAYWCCDKCHKPCLLKIKEEEKKEKIMDTLSKEFDFDKFRKFLIDYKYAHKRGRDSATDDATREFHRGSFIAVGYILSQIRRKKFYRED